MFSDQIEILKKKGLFRKIRDRNALLKTIENTEGFRNSLHHDFEPYGSSHILIEGVEYINFSSNDYLGLSSDKRILESAKEAIDIYGFGSGASRLLSGGTELNHRLERIIADFKGTESALIFNSGYTANTSVIPALADENFTIFSDELNHASIVDGCRLSKGKKVIYNHADLEHLSDLLKKEKGRKKLVVTDTVFSMDGDIAPLRGLYEICERHNAYLYIDDAHGTGVLGNGHGALHHCGVNPTSWIIQMGTFSKALGSFGAYIAADEKIIQWLTNKSRGLIFSTALPACVIAASIKALEIIQNDRTLLKNLWDNRDRLYQGIKNLGFDTLKSETPIIPILPPMIFSEDTIENTNIFSEILKKERIYAPAIRPPTVKIPRIRFSVIASHTKDDIDLLLKALSKFVENKKD